MKNCRTPEQIRMDVLERKLACMQRNFNELKYSKIQGILKELRDFKIDSLICTYIEAKLKNKTKYLTDHQVAAIEDLDDLISTYNEIENRKLPF